MTAIEIDIYDNLGGVGKLYFFDFAEVLYFPKRSGESFTEQIAFYPDVAFARFDAAQDSISYTCDRRKTPHGDLFAHSIKGFIGKDSEALAAALADFKGRKVGVLYVDGNGEQKLIGTPTQYLTFTERLGTGNKPSSRNGYDFEFRGETYLSGGFYPFPLSALSAIADNLEAVALWDCSVELTWANNRVATKHEVWRCKDGGDFVLVFTISDGSFENYNDATVSQNTAYSYTVRSYDVDGFVTAFSNIADVVTVSPSLQLSVSVTSGLSPAITKPSGAAAWWRYGDTILFQSNAPAPFNITAAGTLNVFLDNTDQVTALNFTGMGLYGNVDLSASWTGLLSFTAPDQSQLNLQLGDWVRKANVAINLSNSLVTDARIYTFIDALIIANGGTLHPSDTTTFTGDAGVTFSGRTAVIGTITLDLMDGANALLYSKIVALTAKGWTVTTVKTLCNKQINFNTGDTWFVATTLEKTRKFLGLDYVSGVPCEVDLYDTLANASAGGPTGRLAQGYAASNAWLLNDTNYNAWAEGTEKAIRVYAITSGVTLSKSNLRYQALPTTSRGCGEVVDVLGLSTYAAYSVRLLQVSWAGALLVLRRSTDMQTKAFYPNALGKLRWVDADPSTAGGRSQTVGGTGQAIASTSYAEETSSITSWAGAGTVSVVAVCDQSGNNYHVTTTLWPLLDLSLKGIRATHPDHHLYHYFGTVPSWCNGNVVLTAFCRRRIMASPFGNGSPKVAVMLSLRNGEAGNIPLQYQLNDESTDSDIFYTSKGSNNNIINRASPQYGVYQTLTVARDQSTADGYIDGMLYSSGVNVAAQNNYAGSSNYAFNLGNTTYTGLGRGNTNVPWSDIVIYKNKLDATQVTAVTNLINQ